MKVRRRKVLILALFCYALAGTPFPARGQSQTTSAIQGSVVGTDGRPLADVLITIRHELTGTARSVLSNPDGRFVILLLQAGGPYTVSASRIGLAPAREEGIRLQIGESRSVEFILEEQAVELEGVSVRVDRGEVFRPTRVGPVTLLAEGTLESVPLPSRDVMELARLSPLVRTTETGGFSLAGQNDRYNALLVDGLLNQDAFGLTPGGVPGGQAGAKLLPIDAVAQYEILVAPYDARLSGFAGGVMNAVTKTGTNELVTRGFLVGRHEALMGDLTLPSGTAEASGIDRTLLGLSVGGPIIRDRAHFFISGEFEERRQPPSGFNLGRDDPALVGIIPAVMDSFVGLFQDSLGLDVGVPGPYALSQELANVFARVDWTFENGSRLTARNVFARARNEEPPNRAPFEPYGLSSNAVNRTSSSNTFSLQYFSELGSRSGNEVDLSINRTIDESAPRSTWPQVEAVLKSPESAVTTARPIRAGAQFFAQANDLAQTSVRLSNTLTLARGRHTWSLGVQGTWYDIENTYLPGATGDYYYAWWEDVRNNAPQRYQRAVLEEGQEPGIGFNVAQAGAFVQDIMDLGRGLTLRFGLRMDAPFVLDTPAENPRVLEFFGRSTSEVPSGMVLLSPRIGFNWQSRGELRTQVRGGAGIFTGQLPYVWLANAFHHTGMRSHTILCEGRWTDEPIVSNTAPPLDPSNPEPTCLFGAPDVVRVATLFEDGFAYPQYAKFSLSVDRELTPTVSASVGGIFSHSINQVLIRELNIAPRTEALGSLRGYGGTDRDHFGVPVTDGYRPIRLLPDYEQVLLLMNGEGDRAWSLSAELKGSLTRRLGFQLAYAYARSYDRMSLGSVDMVSNFGLTPTHGDPNDPPLTPSNYDRPHKVVVALYGTPVPGLENTEVSLLYTGESGLPFSYVYDGDINGDGYPFAGPATDRNNDLLWVPEDAFQVPSSFSTFTRLAAALETDPCLRQFQGRFMTRNGCRAPWQNRLDLRLAQTLSVRGTRVRLEADVLNVLNLMNPDWGLVRAIPPVSPLLHPFDRMEDPPELLVDWAAGLLPFRNEDGELTTPEPWSVVSPVSQWQAQLGIRVTFGGGGDAG